MAGLGFVAILVNNGATTLEHGLNFEFRMVSHHHDTSR